MRKRNTSSCPWLSIVIHHRTEIQSSRVYRRALCARRADVMLDGTTWCRNVDACADRIHPPLRRCLRRTRSTGGGGVASNGTANEYRRCQTCVAASETARVFRLSCAPQSHGVPVVARGAGRGCRVVRSGGDACLLVLSRSTASSRRPAKLRAGRAGRANLATPAPLAHGLHYEPDPSSHSLLDRRQRGENYLGCMLKYGMTSEPARGAVRHGAR